MLFQNRKLIMTACTSLAFVGFSLGGVHASETALNTDSPNFQSQKYHYPSAEALNKSVTQARNPVTNPGNMVANTTKPVTRAPARFQRPPVRRSLAANYNTVRPYPNTNRPYSARPPVNQPLPYGRPGSVAGPRPVNRPGSRPAFGPRPVARPGSRPALGPRPVAGPRSVARPGTMSPPYARRGAVPPPQRPPGYMPPPPRPAGAPPLNPPFAGPGNRSIPGKSSVVILDPDIPEEYAKNPYINGTYNSKPPPPVNGPNNRRRGGGSGPFKKMGFGPFNGNDAPWETWPFGSRDSFWSRKEVPFKSLKPADWFKPGDPKEGLADMWDDLIAAPDDLGTMPGGWNVPSVSVPNPVDLEDQFQKASKEVPDLIRVYED